MSIGPTRRPPQLLRRSESRHELACSIASSTAGRGQAQNSPWWAEVTPSTASVYLQRLKAGADPALNTFGAAGHRLHRAAPKCVPAIQGKYSCRDVIEGGRFLLEVDDFDAHQGDQLVADADRGAAPRSRQPSAASCAPHLNMPLARQARSRFAVPRWMGSPLQSGAPWNAEAARQDDTGRKFWALVSTMPLTLLTLANLFVAWRAASIVRGWWLAAALLALADRLFTFSYFIPTMVGLMEAPDSPASVAVATRWSNLNYLRHGIVLAAWLASLKTFALFYQQRG